MCLLKQTTKGSAFATSRVDLLKSDWDINLDTSIIQSSLLLWLPPDYNLGYNSHFIHNLVNGCSLPNWITKKIRPPVTYTHTYTYIHTYIYIYIYIY